MLLHRPQQHIRGAGSLAWPLLGLGVACPAMERPANPRRRRISARTKLAFSSGSLEQAMVGAAGVATMIYYNQVLGVSPALCGTAFLIASVVDAVSDPLVGALSDSVRTRWGRRHPFMFLSAFPLADVHLRPCLRLLDRADRPPRHRARARRPRGGRGGSVLTRLMDKKNTVISMIAVTAFLIGLPYCLRLLGRFPENGSIWLLVAFFGIWGIGFITLPVVPVVIDSQLVDVADEHELNTGNRAEGVIFAVRTFAIKLTQGLGGLIAGFGLEIIGFPQDAAMQGVSPEVIDGLLFMMGPLYYIIVYGGLGFAFMYRIDKTRHEEILQALEARRASS